MTVRFYWNTFRGCAKGFAGSEHSALLVLLYNHEAYRFTAQTNIASTPHFSTATCTRAKGSAEHKLSPQCITLSPRAGHNNAKCLPHEETKPSRGRTLRQSGHRGAHHLCEKTFQAPRPSGCPQHRRRWPCPERTIWAVNRGLPLPE